MKLLFCIVPSFLHHASCSDRGSHSFISSYFLQCLSKLKYSFEYKFQFDLSNVVCVSLCFNCHSFLPAWMVKVLQLLNIFPILMWEGKDHLSWPSSEVITLPNASQDSINLYIFIYVFFSCYLLKIFSNISDNDLTRCLKMYGFCLFIWEGGEWSFRGLWLPVSL